MRVPWWPRQVHGCVHHGHLGSEGECMQPAPTHRPWLQQSWPAANPISIPDRSVVHSSLQCKRMFIKDHAIMPVRVAMHFDGFALRCG